MTRISYGYDGSPGGNRHLRQKKAVEDARERFPKATSINATLSPDVPGGTILVEVIVPEDAVAEYYGSEDSRNQLVREAAEGDPGEGEEELGLLGLPPDLGPETPGYIGVDDFGHPLYELTYEHPIAVELLTAEHEHLLQQHFDDGAVRRTCKVCDRAHAVKVELDSLKKGAS